MSATLHGEKLINLASTYFRPTSPSFHALTKIARDGPSTTAHLLRLYACFQDDAFFGALQYCFGIQLPNQIRTSMQDGAIGHDIGKVANLEFYESSIVATPQQRRDIIQAHPRDSVILLKIGIGNDQRIKRMVPFAAFHHSNYPHTPSRWKGLSHKSRTVAITFSLADQVEALTAPRPYHDHFSNDEIRNRLASAFPGVKNVEELISHTRRITI